VQAWNVDTARKVWTHNYRQANWGPILTTGGNLVFAGRHARSELPCVRRHHGKLLWEFKKPVRASKVRQSSFEIDGKQYIAVLAGWGADAAAQAATVARLLGEPVPDASGWWAVVRLRS
jgi:alcohol dehydrogenase (cytochrome c)